MPDYTILIVEDEVVVSIDIETKLNQLGYGVGAVVRHGEKALEMAREISPDLVLMDIHLKGEMDGIEAASLIRNELDLPVIYLTAFSDEKTLARAKITAPLCLSEKTSQPH